MSTDPSNGSTMQGSGSEVEEVAVVFTPSIIDIFADPVKVFRRIAMGLAWWKPFIILSVVTIIIGYFSLPIQQHLMEINVYNMPEEQLERATAAAGKFGLIGIIASPVLILLVLLITAGVAHIIINLLSTNSNFKKTLSLITFCGFIGILGQIINVVVIRLRGIETIESIEDATLSFSLAALIPNVKGVWYAFLESVGLFQIWYYVLVIVGVSIIFKIDKKKAVAPAVAIWVINFLLLMLQGMRRGVS